MGVTKKASVVAKTATRKVALTRSDVELAKHFNVPLETIAKNKLPKRGRPVGSKNKPKKLSSEGWVPEDYDYKKLSAQLQEALAAQMVENQALESIVADFKKVIRLDTSFTFWDRLVFLFSGKL